MIIIISILLTKRSKNDQGFIRGISRNHWITTINDSISDVNNKDICSSLLMYYLGTKNEDKFVSTAAKLGYSM